MAATAETRHVVAGTWLFRQGDEADYLAAVVSGQLEIIIETGDAESIARRVGRGAALGELALLTSTPRSASVRAVRDTELVVISRTAFDVALADAEFSAAVARSVAADLRDSRGLDLPLVRPSVFAVVGLEARAPVAEVAAGFVTELRRWSRVAVLDDAAERPAALAELEQANDHVVLSADGRDEEWLEFCLRSADRVLAVAHRQPSSGWALDADQKLAASDLVVAGEPPATAISSWMRLLGPHARHTVHVETNKGMARLARRVTGRSIGLVLSGGGARGLAHLGVLRALNDAGFEIDRTGGCSMGALFAVMCALEWRVDDMERLCREELVPKRMPRLGLLTARRAGTMLERAFGTKRMEALPIEAFAVSADLVTGELVVHREGSIRDAVAASMAIPGLTPPIASNGRFLVDGGVLDNLPVDVMADADPGLIIAVDVMRRPGLWRDKSPGIADTMARAVVLGGWQRAEQNRARADVLIAPVVDSVGLLEFDEIDDAIAAGYEAATTALSTWK